MFGGNSAVAQTYPFDDEHALAQAATYLTGVVPRLWEPPPDAASELIADADNDSAGDLPASVPAALVDIQAGAIFVIPAADISVLQRTCLNPPPGVVVSCDGTSITGAMALVLLRLGVPLPEPWSPVDSQALYIGAIVDATPGTTDGIGDPFHGAGTGVVAAGYGARGWEPFLDGTGTAMAPPFIALFPSAGIAAIDMPVTALQHGMRPFVSFAGPPQTPDQGVFDLLGEPGTPPSDPDLDEIDDFIADVGNEDDVAQGLIAFTLREDGQENEQERPLSLWREDDRVYLSFPVGLKAYGYHALRDVVILPTGDDVLDDILDGAARAIGRRVNPTSFDATAGRLQGDRECQAGRG